jgi:hypothetical protein
VDATFAASPHCAPGPSEPPPLEATPPERDPVSTPPPDPARIVLWLLVVILFIVMLAFLFSLFDVTID